jgi:predicted AAA+ superfamily ATPase
MLRKKYRELFYFREKHECDFIVKEKTKVTKAIQVCYEVTSRNKDREIRGLLEAMEMFDLKEGYILTGKQEDLLTVDGRTIILTPARSFTG